MNNKKPGSENVNDDIPDIEITEQTGFSSDDQGSIEPSLDSLVSARPIDAIQGSSPESIDTTTELGDNAVEKEYVTLDISNLQPIRNRTKTLYAKLGTLVGRVFKQSYDDNSVAKLFGVEGIVAEAVILDGWKLKGSLVPTEDGMYLGEDLVRFAFKMGYADFFKNVGYKGDSDDDVLLHAHIDMTEQPVEYPSSSGSMVASPKKEKIKREYRNDPVDKSMNEQKTRKARYTQKPKVSSPETPVPVSQEPATNTSYSDDIVGKYFDGDPDALAVVRKMDGSSYDWNYALSILPNEIGASSAKVFGILEVLMNRDLAKLDDRQRFVLNPPSYES